MVINVVRETYLLMLPKKYFVLLFYNRWYRYVAVNRFQIFQKFNIDTIYWSNIKNVLTETFATQLFLNWGHTIRFYCMYTPSGVILLKMSYLMLIN